MILIYKCKLCGERYAETFAGEREELIVKLSMNQLNDKIHPCGKVDNEYGIAELIGVIDK